MRDLGSGIRQEKASMNLSHLLTVVLTFVVVCFVSGAEASPYVQQPMFSPLPQQAGLRCGLVNGQLVCGNKKSGSQQNDDDGNGDNDPTANALWRLCGY
jgi:hypothetical protein